MATKLKGLAVTSVDLVDQGANPDAHIRLFKRGGPEPEPAGDADEGMIRKFLTWLRKGGDAPESSGAETSTETVEKEAQSFSENISREQMRAIMSQIYDYCYALSDSFCSIICDKELDTETKKGMILTSLNEFTAAIQGAAGQWAAGQKVEDLSGSSAGIQKSTAQQQGLEKLLQKHEKSGVEPSGTFITETEEKDTMRIDKSKMTPEEQAMLAAFEKRYGVPDDAPAAGLSAAGDSVAKGAEVPQSAADTELHPEVQKALAEFQELAKRRDAEVEELKKSLEMERLTSIAKKYEVTGKKADELAAKLYELKKAGGTVYDDYVALLDENVNAITKGGLFGEIGSNRSGSAGTKQALDIKAAELAKSAAGSLTTPEAIVKAWEENPELAAQYEAEYMGGK